MRAQFKLAEGATIEDLPDAYPRLVADDIRAAPAYAADTIAHETVLALSSESIRPMRFLADECCDFAAVQTLRAHGHDVLAVDVMDLALAENRILPTEDKDFGWLVFAGRTDSPGVIPMRFPASVRSSLAEAVLIVPTASSTLPGAVSHGVRARFSELVNGRG